MYPQFHRNCFWMTSYKWQLTQCTWQCTVERRLSCLLYQYAHKWMHGVYIDRNMLRKKWFDMTVFHLTRNANSILLFVPIPICSFSGFSCLCGKKWKWVDEWVKTAMAEYLLPHIWSEQDVQLWHSSVLPVTYFSWSWVGILDFLCRYSLFNHTVYLFPNI